VRDLSLKDINSYHKFLWSNHLSYAATYEPEHRFARENINESRREFFSDLGSLLKGMGIHPGSDVKSVFEVGCSLGYQLRHMETDLFTGAEALEGIDIDEYAVLSGMEHLSRIGSGVKLRQADMESIEDVLEGRLFDVIICTGVLMYLNEKKASLVVKRLLQHTGKVLAVAGLAHPETDNSLLSSSAIRESDRSFIHNVSKMVREGGGTVLEERWEGEKVFDDNTIYFVFAKRSSM
jgi:SAM-dependent methyltransferase